MNAFTKRLQQHVLILDGAMGTSIHDVDLDLDRDYLGKENCTEILVQTRPDVIGQIHESFLSVGADGVETDTFGANKLVLAEFDLADQTFQLNKQAGEIARTACDKFSCADKPRFVVGSIGPGTKLLTLGFTDWDTMFDSYREQVRGLIAGGVDVLLIETAQDILQVKCAINAALEALQEKNKTVDDMPIMVQVTIEQQGTMLVGTDIAAAATTLSRMPILSLGLNCATGPMEMAEHLQWLSKYWPGMISVQPNAGLPKLVEGRTEYPLEPQPFADKVLEYVESCGINIVGGCCGTTPEHLETLVKAVGQRAPAQIKKEPVASGCSSLYAPVEYRQDTSILNIGERTNASGSRMFKRLLEEEDQDQMVSLARQMVREGSHVIDVNVDYAGRDNAADMAKIVSQFAQQVQAPMMLDSTQAATIEAGLKHAPGKCIINSANLEDGEEKFGQMCQLARRYGAALVLGCIDEDPEEAMARTSQRKLAIAQRMHKIATETHGLDAGDLMFDPLVLPITTGMDKDRPSGMETIAGTRAIAKALPQCQIICGLSNISFGLKPAARVALNSVFLHELVEAGMTGAILHITKILPQTRIDEQQWQAALDLIYDRKPEQEVTLRDGSTTTDPLQIFIDLFSDDNEATEKKQDISELPLDERLQKYIIDGEKQGLIETLDEARQLYSPLEIINNHLLEGMKVVGELFGSGQMQLPFVLQSAQVMKMAVAHLEQFMEKTESANKGSIVLATVKGDVHDIGKNLVDIILSNNGYTVYNLGIKQPINHIIAEFKRLGADTIGLSGLLVKSVTVMGDDLEALNSQTINAPVLLGGAALSRHYCESHLRSLYHGPVHYGKDAFEGLRVMNAIKAGKADDLEAQIETRLAKRADVDKKINASQRAKGSQPAVATAERSDVATDEAIPKTPFLGDRMIETVPLEEIYPYVNTVALFRGQWQFKKGRMTDAQFSDQLHNTVEPLFASLQKELSDVLQPAVVYGYFPCNADGDDLIVYDPEDHDREIERFAFPRQAKRRRLCISDFFRPLGAGEKDVIAMHCVTMGKAVSKKGKELFESDDYAKYLYVHGMGVECAEALAELWHKRIRREMGIDGDDAPEVRDLFTQHYRGSRYSFGYPACPDMADQEKIFRLLKPQRMGCELTENWQIDPEQSTSAIIAHHRQAKYFNV
jgi:5-methyltetrahydrofolate--homocysteine methyltransferase